ncbi:amino acid adenylation domain-containing protein [Nonomuraea solani]|uniref:Amino acid adenylation domain-containing protein n=1 Tax=Nonomuraea solani TaxID=1144553 RepID=A0A1H6EXL7_9ACTN|nr:non-ribosomal peptide synthetase [Nonomuraea solani]SEH01851.1 amino acid adenylation domain-containing protein [Nonomuraea solani]
MSEDTRLSGVKEELLQRWLGGETPPERPAERIPRRERAGPVPLSLAQQRLWFIEQLQPGGTAYNLSFCARVDAELEPSVLAACVDALVDRHETLRTVVRKDEGTARAVVDGGARPVLDVADLRALPPAEGLTAAVGRVQAAADQPFDLEKGPVARILLCRVRGHDVLGVVVHHLFADGWSLGVAMGELSASYAARASGVPFEPPALPVQYGDFAAWQAGAPEEPEWKRDLDYWRDRLADAPPLELPADRPRPPLVSAAGGWCALSLTEELSESVRGLARRAGATPFMVVLAAWQALLAKLTGLRDITVGTNVAGRTRPEIYGLIGNFVNMLALRTELRGDPTFTEALDRVKATCAGAFAHQSLPFERMVREVQPSVRSLFIMQPPLGQADFAGASFEAVPVTARSARADLELHLRDGRALEGHVAFSSDLFDAATAERITARFAALLEQAVRDPEQRLSELSPLSPGERDLVRSWGRGPELAVPAEPAHELIRRQALRDPQRIAVVCGSLRLDYGTLDGRAAQLARHLIELGAGPEKRVAICLGRSPEMIVAMLGVLKTGAAYVPLDPRHPPERLAALAADAGAALVVTEESLAAAFPETVCVDRDGPAIAGRSSEDPGVAVPADGLAYIVYTSGSTGTPKGVAIGHRALSSLVAHVRHGQDLGRDDIMATVSSLAFDASVAEIYPVLTAGGAVVIATMEEILDATRLRRLILTHRVSALLATPTMWRTIVAAGGLGQRKVKALSGAEALPGDLADVLASTHDRAWNLYGPTETTVWTTADPLVAGRPVSLGSPVAGSVIRLLDPDLRETPVGVPGEICVGGPGLARGYHDRPALTAERFVPDPYASGARLYRTGDLARYRRDGSLEYLGRADDQVKLRGQRIEPGEVEAALRAHPTVEEAVVVLDERGQAGSRLVAYVTRSGLSTSAEVRDPALLVRHLRERLPEAMVPAAYVVLDRFPVNASGKLDRRRLPAPDSARLPATPRVEPRTPLEEEIAQVACELLGVPELGVHDDFFDLGGHSLLVAQLVDRLRQRYGIELLLQDLFSREPNVEQLALIVDDQVRRKRQLDSATERMGRRVGEMPDQTVDALLAQLLAEGG